MCATEFLRTANGVLYQGNVLEVLKQIPSETVDCVVTSPPYWNLRDYSNKANTIWDGDPNCEHGWDFGEKELDMAPSDKSTLHDGKGVNAKEKAKKLNSRINYAFCKKCGAFYGQLGQEPDFKLYLQHLWQIFDEIYRVLKPTGTCFVNIGDTYFSKSKLTGVKINAKYREKSLCLIPERFAIGMAERGWILRNVIIWRRPNAMPEGVRDRFTVDYEYIYFFVKNKDYFFEQQFDPYIHPLNRWGGGRLKPNGEGLWDRGTGQNTYRERDLRPNLIGRNKRTVWDISTKPLPEAHFASFPVEIPEVCIKAGAPLMICKKCKRPRKKIIDKNYIPTRPGKSTGNGKSGTELDPHRSFHENDISKYRMQIEYFEIGYTNCGCGAGWDAGVVLDPFMGSGTTAIAAEKLGRKWIGIEINPDYCKIAEKRLKSLVKQIDLIETAILQ